MQLVFVSAKPVVQAFNHGPPGFARTASIDLGDIYRTASAISVFLEEADARPFINRLMSMPVMNAEGVVSRPVLDASTINPNIEVCLRAACLTGYAGCELMALLCACLPACLPVGLAVDTPAMYQLAVRIVLQ